MFKKNFQKKFLISIITLSFFSLPLLVSAAGILPSCAEAGDCQISGFMQLAVNVADWILGVVGSAALLMFVYGGITLTLSAGNEANVKKGKDIIIGAITGMVIVFTSYIIIQFSLAALGTASVETQTGYKKGVTTWFSTSWFAPVEKK